MTLDPGTRLGPYEIEALLGEGGMGVVYKARDVRLKREAAIKVLPPEFAADADRLRRFEQEAQAASALNHTNIATIYGIDAEGSTSFIAMEYVPGRTLAQTIPRHGLEVNRALRYAVQIADALARAHGSGIVHRDLKPGNIMVTPDDRVKLLDFGVAKFVQRDVSTPGDRTHTVNDPTAEGMVVGTTRYLSPEQARAQHVDARADIFSFGAVLYEMLTGGYAFDGESALEISTAILRDNPRPLSDVAPGIPRDVERLVARCLRKDPDRRFQTAADLRVALEDLRDESEAGERQGATPVGRPRRRILIAIASSLAVVAAVALWLAQGGGQGEAPASSRLRIVPLTSDPGDEVMPSLSPDGSQVVFVAGATGQGDPHLYVVALETGARLQLTSKAGPYRLPRWSPDGRWIAFERQDHGLFLISPLGGPERALLADMQFINYAWMADSRRIVFSGPDGSAPLQTVDINDGETQRLAAVPHLQGRLAALYGSAIAVSEDGELIATGETDPVSQESRIVVRALTAGLPERSAIRLGSRATVLGIQFLPARQGLVYGATFGPYLSRLYRSSLSGSDSERLPDIDYPAAFPSLSASGDKLAFTRFGGDDNLYKLQLEDRGETASGPTVFAASTTRDAKPHISADGTKVVFASRRTGSPEIHVADASGQNVQRLTSMRAMIGGSPRFSPDGTQIAFDSRPEDGQLDVFVMPADGGLPLNLTDHPATDSVPTWSHDGAFIYFHSDRTGSSQVWKMRPNGEDPRQITRDGGYAAYESVDRASIFYGKTDGGTSLWTAGANGGNERMVVDTLYRHNVAPAASGVYLSTGRGLEGGPEILFYRFEDKTTQTVYRLSGDVALGLSLAPDESWMLFAQTDGSGADLMLIEGFGPR